MKNDSISVDNYISDFPESIQKNLNNIRNLVSENIPNSKETMSYGIPTFDLNGEHLVHYACHKGHIGFYPGPEAIEYFKDNLSGYKTSKGTIQFPLDSPIPYDLIVQITAFCVERNSAAKK